MPSSNLTDAEWKNRCRARLVAMGIPAKDADQYAEAIASVPESREEEPEDAADTELSYAGEG